MQATYCDMPSRTSHTLYDYGMSTLETTIGNGKALLQLSWCIFVRH